MISHRLLLSLAILAGLSAPATTPCEKQGNSRDVRLWERFLEWLPEDTETLFVAEGPFAVPQRKQRIGFEESARLLPTGPLLVPPDGLLSNQLIGQKILCAVEGSRHFRPPQGLGMMPYQGAHIVQFEASASNAVNQAFQFWLKRAQRSIELAGKQIAVFTELQERDTWSYFIAHPKPGVLIFGTDQAYLEETLERSGRKPARRALPSDLPEWQNVDSKADVWAIRHYRRESAGQDPSSPLGGAAPANVPDPAAIGLTFWYNAHSDNATRVRYLSTATNACEIVSDGWNNPSEGLTPEIKQVGLGSVEILTSVSQERTGRSFLFVLLAYLGHAIYL